MGRWVTLQDDQKVFISAGGKVLASRSAISKAGGAKERGKALAARSKAAIGKATGKVRAAAHNEAQAKGLAKDIIASHGKDALKEVGRRLDRSAQYDRSVQGKDWQPSQQTNNLVVAKEHVQKHFESATTRAIEHAKTEAVAHNKAKGRGTPERQALADYYREDRANTAAAKVALAKATASTRNPVTTQGVELIGKPGNAPQVAASKFKVPTELKVPEKVRAAALAKSNAEMREQARAAGWGKSKPKPTITPKQHAAQVAKFEKSNQAPGKTKVGWGFNNRDAEAKQKATPEKQVQKPGAYRTDYEKEVAREAEYQKYKQVDIRSQRVAKRATPEATQQAIEKAKGKIAEARNERYQYKREDLLDRRAGPGKGGKTADIRLRNADKRADLAEDKRRAHQDLLKTPEAQLRVKAQNALANEREKAKFPLFRGESPAVRPLTGQSPATARAIEHAKAAQKPKRKKG